MSIHHNNLDRRRWAWVRRKVLKRDNWRCRDCGRYGNEVDHIVPLKWKGAPYAESNLQCLCKRCHINKTRLESGRPPDPARQAWALWLDKLTAAND